MTCPRRSASVITRKIIINPPPRGPSQSLNGARQKETPPSRTPNRKTKHPNTKTLVGVCEMTMRSAISWYNCPAILTSNGEISISTTREERNWRGSGSTQEDNHLNGVTVDSLWVDVVCEGRRFGHDGTVEGVRCARFQCVIILGHRVPTCD